VTSDFVWPDIGDDELPDRCQQFGCTHAAETWCPLCRAYFCHVHDELYPVRRHDCLRGKAEAA
jgi:hypothetical protein